MPFGLCNAPSTFQSYINEGLHDILDVYCTAYLDDVLVFSSSMDEHRKHVREVLTRLRRAGLHVDIKKTEFHRTEVKYLGIIISTEGLKMDPDKVKAVREWATPRNTHDVLSFLGFANFYRRFIKDFGRIAMSLTELTKGKKKVKTEEGAKLAWTKPVFQWTPEAQTAFERLRDAFSIDMILAHFDFNKATVIEVDASDYVVAGVLSQRDSQDVLRPVAYFSKKMTPQECNYEIYDKELLAIVRAFEEWTPEVAGANEPVSVYTDHQSLQYFMTTKQLNRRQARWSEFLSEFKFIIHPVAGKKNTKADALTRRSQDLPADAEDERLRHQHQVVLKPQNLGVGTLLPTQLAQVTLIAKELVELEEEQGNHIPTLAE